MHILEDCLTSQIARTYKIMLLKFKTQPLPWLQHKNLIPLSQERYYGDNLGTFMVTYWLIT